jgi:uncharacterized protein (DUF952 family)
MTTKGQEVVWSELETRRIAELWALAGFGALPAHDDPRTHRSRLNPAGWPSLPPMPSKLLGGGLRPDLCASIVGPGMGAHIVWYVCKCMKPLTHQPMTLATLPCLRVVCLGRLYTWYGALPAEVSSAPTSRYFGAERRGRTPDLAASSFSDRVLADVQEGFTHSTATRSLLLPIANLFYKGKTGRRHVDNPSSYVQEAHTGTSTDMPGDFVLLWIDPAKLSAEVKYEAGKRPTRAPLIEGQGTTSPLTQRAQPCRRLSL